MATITIQGRAQRRLKEQGLCTQYCGRPAKPGQTRCVECAFKATTVQTLKRVNKGANKCSYCRQPGHKRPRCAALSRLFMDVVLP